MTIYVINCTIAIQISPEMNAKIEQTMTRDSDVELEE